MVGQFWRWLETKRAAEGTIGEVARFLEEHPEYRIVRESDNIAAIGSELFSRRVTRGWRTKVRWAHSEWRLAQLRRKYGEWPIDTGRKR